MAIQRKLVLRRQIRGQKVVDFLEKDSDSRRPYLTNVKCCKFLGASSCFSGTVCLAADLTHCINCDHLFKAAVIIPKVINVRASLPSCKSDAVISHITEYGLLVS